MGYIAIIGARNLALKLGALACVAVLGGCGGVELEGKVFDYAGLSGDRKQVDPQMSTRAPLMVPPSVQTLPTPTQARSVAAARQDWPDDPEKVRTRIIEEKEAVKAEAEADADPINPYAGKETLLDQLFGGKKTVEEPVPDVPEPDASDQLPGNTVASQSGGQAPHVPQAPLPSQNQDAFNPAAPDSYRNVSGGQNSSAAF